MRLLFIILILIFNFHVPHALAANKILPENFLTDENLDLFCLRLSYPQIHAIKTDNSGKTYIGLRNGQTVPYISGVNQGLNVDLKKSMALPYPLEPVRPALAPGQSPGRFRPYAFLNALYGDNQSKVQSNLRSVSFQNAVLRLSPGAAQAFERARNELSRVNEKKYLKPDGAFYWRKISGESVQSAHSFGIAIDLGSKYAPYWRWNKTMPHPLQKTYPPKIVEAMEKHGFIWGGKWHEYDLMHFEYRPELLCKARMKRYMGK